MNRRSLVKVPGSRAWHRGPVINRLIGNFTHSSPGEQGGGEERGRGREEGRRGREREGSGEGERGETGRRWGEREGW